MTGRAMHRTEHEHAEDRRDARRGRAAAGRLRPTPTMPAAKATTPAPVMREADDGPLDRERRTRSMATSRRAAMGATRLARRAGADGRDHA